MRVTKALLIEKGKELNLSLNSKMKLAEMQAAIEKAAKELNTLKLGDLVKTARYIRICGYTSNIPKNAVLKIAKHVNESDTYVRAANYPNQTASFDSIRKDDLIKIGPEEMEKAEKTFEKANSYSYATID